MTDHTVLVLLDAPATELHAPELEALTLARRLGRVEVLGLSAPGPEVLAQLGAYGVALAHVAGLPAGDHPATALVDALVAAVETGGADIVLATSTFAHKEVAALAAHRLGAALVVDANGVTDDGALQVTQRVFAGGWDVVSRTGTARTVVTLRPNSLPPEPADQATVPVLRALPVEVRDTGVRVVSRVERPSHDGGRPALAEAAIVVAGGRGTNGDFAPVLDLADALGAAVGATRDVVYEGWFDQFVGQTGVTVAPRLYIGAGISGAPHHRGGMQASQVVVAVNNDPECPLFEISDFAVVGDLADVLPQAAAAIRAHKAGAGE